MKFNADKKQEHETAAEKALNDRDYKAAYYHTAKAAEFGLKLAESHDGKVAKSYVDDAEGLIEYAKKLKVKHQKSQEAKKQGATEKDKGEGLSIKDGGEDNGKSGDRKFEMVEKPTIRLDDVAGLKVVKQVLRDSVIKPFEEPEVFDRFGIRPGAGVLLYGPPGNGKTFVAKAIAGELDAAFFNVVLSQMKSKYVGETEKNITALFEEARRHERAVLFLDECDALLRKRGNQKVNAVNQFLTEVDGLKSNDNCMLLLLATNKPWILDEAVTRAGRIGVHIYVGLPDEAARAGILRYAMKGVPMHQSVDVEEIAARTKGYSGAEIGADKEGSICTETKQSARRRQSIAVEQARASGTEVKLDEVVTMADFDHALSKIKPMSSKELIQKYIAFRDSCSDVPGVGGEGEVELG
ncbi:MAG: ATP-binding protein [Planctomycetota bacterium]|jgi:SpoVK/Ycf46/Vps4 family AAA+-type ATPase|nr:ATP-binding protein [Planctomycetota bacterium]